MSTSSDKVKCTDDLLLQVLLPQKDERLDNVINKLKIQCKDIDKQNSIESEIVASCKGTDGNSAISKAHISENKNTVDQSTVLVKNIINRKPTDDKSLNKSYLTWENSSNLCWLDASMSLLVHNKTLCHLIPKDSTTQTANIIKSYDEAISIFNDHSNDRGIEERLQKAKGLLKSIQESVFKYLKPFLKCADGKPDSAFCSLLNLIGKDQEIKDCFFVRYAWHLICKKCSFSSIRNYEKPIITFNEVKHFIPYSPVSFWKCPKCEIPKQEICLEYKTLPQCLIFHFENGAGKGEFDAEKLDFEVNGRKYKLSGLLTLQKRSLSINHYVTFIRNVITGYWLECDDLNYGVSSFTMSQPTINLEDISIVSYEAMDNDGTIILKEESEDATMNNDEDYLLIDLEDESEDNANNQTGETEANCSFRLGKNCDKSENMSTEFIDNKTVKCSNLDDARESISSLKLEDFVKDDTLLNMVSLAPKDPLAEFQDCENNEMSTKTAENLLKYIEKEAERDNSIPLQDSSACKFSNVAENDIECNTTKEIEESLLENKDDIFKTELEICLVENKMLPSNILENATIEAADKITDDTCLLQDEPVHQASEIQVKKSDSFLQKELKLCTIDRDSIRCENVPVPLRSNSIELTKTVVVKSKKIPDTKTFRRNTKMQKKILNCPSQQQNTSKVLHNVSVLVKNNDKTAVKNLINFRPEPIQRSARIVSQEIITETTIDNKKMINESKLRQNEGVTEAVTGNLNVENVISELPNKRKCLYSIVTEESKNDSDSSLNNDNKKTGASMRL